MQDTIQELAQALLHIEADVELNAVAAIETATFEPYATEYIVARRPGCKGCHGG